MWREARQNGLGTPEPKPGDIFIQVKESGKGHTGFVVSVSADGKHIYTGEGNCGNRLKIGRRTTTSIHHYIDCLGDEQTTEFERKNFDVAVVDAQGTR